MLTDQEIEDDLKLCEKATIETWLVERGQTHGQTPSVWWSGDGWSTDPLKAMRFNTELAADNYARDNYQLTGIDGVHPRMWSVTQHVFLDPIRERHAQALRDLQSARQELKELKGVVEAQANELKAWDEAERECELFEVIDDGSWKPDRIGLKHALRQMRDERLAREAALSTKEGPGA